MPMKRKGRKQNNLKELDGEAQLDFMANNIFSLMKNVNLESIPCVWIFRVNSKKVDNFGMQLGYNFMH